MPVSLSVVLAYVIGIIFLFILGRFLLVPLKVVMKLVYNAVLGAIALLLINLIGGLFGFHIALNILSAFIAGVLGIPGIALLVILKIIFKA